MTLFSRRKILQISAATAALSPLPLRAASRRVSANSAGVAIDGYDTMAYWQLASAQMGAATYTASWRGVTWQFSSQQNADVFGSTPSKFTPQFGGFCTRAMSFGKVVDGDPEVWRIYKDKLYLFARPVGGEKFDKGQDAMIAKAETHWQTLA